MELSLTIYDADTDIWNYRSHIWCRYIELSLTKYDADISKNYRSLNMMQIYLKRPKIQTRFDYSDRQHVRSDNDMSGSSLDNSNVCHKYKKYI